MKTLKLDNVGELPYSTEEALNRLRVNVGFCGDRFKKVIVTSSLPNEGKSFICTQLWRMLAEAGVRVVLVDADMRKSVMRARHRISTKKGELTGLTHYLAGRAQLDDVLYATNLENGYMIPVGNTVTNPALLLQGSRLSGLLDHLAEQYDCALVDTPPLSSVSDGDLIASRCDGALFVLRAGSTPRGLAGASLNQLRRAGCELMGIILNRVETKMNPYYYKYSKYGYGYGYYGGTEDGGGTGKDRHGLRQTDR